MNDRMSQESLQRHNSSTPTRDSGQAPDRAPSVRVTRYSHSTSTSLQSVGTATSAVQQGVAGSNAQGAGGASVPGGAAPETASLLPRSPPSLARALSEVEETASLVRRFLVMISPKSGAGNAMSHWRRTVQPLFLEADVQCEVLVTQRRRHAYDYFRDELTEAQILSFDAIAILGGDGIVFEVVNGVMARPGRAEEENLALLRRMTLMPLGGGTGNGLAASLLHERQETKDVLHAAFLAVKGRRRAIDLTRVVSPTVAPTVSNDDEHHAVNSGSAGETQFAFLTLMWGMLADIDLESEWLRCLGESRLYVYAVHTIMRKRLYPGRISLKLVRSWSTYTREGSFYEARVNRMEERESVDDDGWLHLEDSFLSVNVFQVSHISTSAHVCPGKHLDDGLFLVAVIDKSVSRAALLRMLLTVDDGGLFDDPHVRVFRCSAYVFEPNEEVPGNFSLDGERLRYGRVEGQVVGGATSVLL